MTDDDAVLAKIMRRIIRDEEGDTYLALSPSGHLVIDGSVRLDDDERALISRLFNEHLAEWERLHPTCGECGHSLGLKHADGWMGRCECECHDERTGP